MKNEKPKHVSEIAYARASIRNLIERDETGDTEPLEKAIEMLTRAERLCLAYQAIGTEPES